MCTGSIDITKFQQFQWIREQLEKEGVTLHVPTGN